MCVSVGGGGGVLATLQREDLIVAVLCVINQGPALLVKGGRVSC